MSTHLQSETFEVVETNCDGVENDTSAIELIEKLGLEGQKKLLKSKNGETLRNPYREMTREERFVYEQICPKHVKLSEYDDGPIPLRILQVAAHAHELFDRVQVWCPHSGTQSDPVLVGVNGEEYSSARKLFILGRWGAVLEPFEALAKKAVSMYRAKSKVKCQQYITKAQQRLASLDDMVDDVIPVGDHALEAIYF